MLEFFISSILVDRAKRYAVLKLQMIDADSLQVATIFTICVATLGEVQRTLTYSEVRAFLRVKYLLNSRFK